VPNPDQPAAYDYGAAGRLEFSGWVDHEILLRIQADRIFAETVRGKPMESTTFVFSKPLRAGSVHGVRVQKHAGRGQVTLRQVPASSNDFIAVIQIIDPKRGSGFYRFVLHWNDPGG
jgi:hypothetical protein